MRVPSARAQRTGTHSPGALTVTATAGAVLKQDDGQGRRSVAYFLLMLNLHEQRYNIRERNLLAEVKATTTLESLIEWQILRGSRRP